MTTAPLYQIRISCVVAVGASEDSRQTSFALRDHYEVNVISHEAVTPHSQAVALCVIEERIEVHLAVAVCEEDILTPVAALRDVVGGVHSHSNAATGVRISSSQ